MTILESAIIGLAQRVVARVLRVALRVEPVGRLRAERGRMARKKRDDRRNHELAQSTLARSSRVHRTMNPIARAFAMSMKKAETKGRIMNALAQEPWSFVTAVILAIAVGVAPRLIPVKPAEITAAS